jgi:ComF family protein
MAVNQTLTWLENLWQRLYPLQCVLCGAPGAEGLDLCPPCRTDLPFLQTACRRCARPLSTVGICGLCQQQTPPQDRTLSGFHYQSPVDYLILQLKFGGKLHLAPLLGKLTAERLAPHLDSLPECIIPVPLHPHRLRERGFNQALELARPLASYLKIPINAHAVRRIRPTAAQSSLPRQERKQNVRDAFALRNPLAARHVAILDDVLTTGHTVGELAKILRRAGAQTVEVWTCTRAQVLK